MLANDTVFRAPSQWLLGCGKYIQWILVITFSISSPYSNIITGTKYYAFKLKSNLSWKEGEVLSYIDSRRNYDVILMNQLITQTLITSSLPDGRRFESPLPNPLPILGNYGWFRLVPLPERSVINRALRRWTHQANVYMSTTLGLPFFLFPACWVSLLS